MIARIATQSKGVVTRQDLLALGLSAREIEWRAQKGLLLREHRSVYRVGHAAPSTEATYLAAVKACGSGAFLDGRAASFHFGLLQGRPPPPEVLCRTERKVPGVRTRRCRRIDRRDVSEYGGIPTVTVPRALLALAADCSDDELLWACHQAWVRWKVRPEQVLAVLARHPNAKGAGRLRRVVTGETRITLSRLEATFLSLLQLERIELPETNRNADGKYVDCRWRGRLTVELDSYAFHNTRRSWEEQHERRRAARGRGEEFRVYTWRDVTDGRNETANEVRSLLAEVRPA